MTRELSSEEWRMIAVEAKRTADEIRRRLEASLEDARRDVLLLAAYARHTELCCWHEAKAPKQCDCGLHALLERIGGGET